MKQSIKSVLLLLAFASCTTLGGKDPDFAILQSSKAPDLLKQCSRSSLELVNSFWKPTLLEVTTVEEKLPKYLSRVDPKLAKEFNSSQRQYLGYYQGKQRLIYVNAFPRGESSTWREEPVTACDGGISYWGVIYDPATSKFTGPQVNGGD